MFLLDTNIIIYSLKKNQTVIDKFRENRDAVKVISIITYGELIFGAEKSKNKIENISRIHRVGEIFPVISLSPAIMNAYGGIKADLQSKGTIIDEFDLLIAATAIVGGYTLVTNNIKHFKHIPFLTLENWV
jgi:tRNA(fMet)-specific endonuclease VapC